MLFRSVSAEINADAVPAINDEIFELIARNCVPGGTKQNLQSADAVTDWKKTTRQQKILLSDAQTSGGLLLSVPARKLGVVLRSLSDGRTPCQAVIGTIVPRRRELVCFASS